MSENLKVTTSFVREIAQGQADNAQTISQIQPVTDGMTLTMWQSHGVICASSNMRMGQLQDARKDACTAMSDMSTSLSERLTSAAEAYDKMDEELGRLLDRQVRITTMETK